MLREEQAQELSALFRGESFEWSVLILDREGQDIVSPLFIMSDLMEMGVVQCLRMEDARERNLETRAVYFVRETKENIEKIIEDIRDKKYSRIEIVFTGIVSRDLLKELSIKVSKMQESRKIVKITDSIASYSMIHENFYTFNMKRSLKITEEFEKYFKNKNTQKVLGETEMVLQSRNTKEMREDEMPEEEKEKYEGFVERVVMGLVSVFKNEGEMVVYTNHPVSERVGGEFLERISEIKKAQEKNYPNRKRKTKKSLLVILHRKEDLVSPVYHTNTYGSILNEIFDFNLNKLVITDQIKKDQIKKETEIFNLNRYDSFFNKNINEPFPTVVDRVNEELLAYKELTNVSSINMNSGNDEMIRSLVQLPDMVGQNRLLYNHLNIVLNAIEVIKKAHLDELFAIEEGNTLDIPEVEEIIGKIDKTEIIRLSVVIFNKFTKQYPELSKIIDKSVPNKEVFNYIDKNTVKHGIRSKILNNLKRMIGVERSGIIRRVEEVFNRREEEYSSVNVFILGGGTYDEYRIMAEYGETQNIKVSYGSTEILSPSSLISQIEEIVKK